MDAAPLIAQLQPAVGMHWHPQNVPVLAVRVLAESERLRPECDVIILLSAHGDLHGHPGGLVFASADVAAVRWQGTEQAFRLLLVLTTVRGQRVMQQMSGRKPEFLAAIAAAKAAGVWETQP